MKRLKNFGFFFLLVLILISSNLIYGGEKFLFSIDDYFSVVSMNVADMTADGQWLACTVSTRGDSLPRDNYRYGDPSYIAPFQLDVIVLDTKTGEQIKLFDRKKQVRSLTWSQDGKMLAYFLCDNGDYRLYIWHRESQEFEAIEIPQKFVVASNTQLAWSPDGKKLFFNVRDPEWKKKCVDLFENTTNGPIIVHDSEEPFLLWDKLRSKYGNLSIPVIWDRESKNLTPLLKETPLNSVRISRDGSHMIFERDVTEKTDYDVIFGTTNQLEIMVLPDGPPRVLLKDYKRRRLHWNQESTMLAYTEKGDVFVMGTQDEEPRNLTGKKEEDAQQNKNGLERKSNEKSEEKEEKKQRFNVLRFSPDGRQLLCTSSRTMPEEEQPYRQTTPPRQFWLIDIETGDKHVVYESAEEPEARPSLQVVDWSPDGRFVYFNYSAPDKYDRGLVKFDLKSREFTDLLRSGHVYQRWRMSEDGKIFVYSDSDGDFPADWYSTDAKFTRIKKLTDLNPQLREKALSHTELISYRDIDGKQLYGVLFYPANYEKGKKYPLITEVYERYFDNGFNSTLNIFTSAGYAVLHPSVHFNRGYPGEAWAKGALSAINKVIEMGIADSDQLGIQGTSYGGYATVLLITQTDRFKAAINNSGKVNMVSFYTQSPRLGIRNIHAPEKSQDRIGGTMWEYPERYLAHSAILDADRITTPLLCITGDQDPNVEALQSQEIYYALRRLGKKVVWLRYHNGAHGGPHTIEERKDMYQRMLDWYDKYLKED
ncbi:MAG: prolyl oligopeptidase family serine peptidase [Candidatus Aminicenantes bacterium]|nr:MAG: prolyl oligopeptidase family serine peptidase [Candidatus Aminicenantes bacterium]